MGGERETVVPKTATTDKGKSIAVGKVRIHESGGEVHFHDDFGEAKTPGGPIEKLKVAVPVGTWYAAWQKLSTEGGSWRYLDTVNKSAVHVEVWLSVKKGILKCDVCLHHISTKSDTYAALHKFTEGSR